VTGPRPIATVFVPRLERSFGAAPGIGLNRKAQLLELCARIGFTPPLASSLVACLPFRALLEVFPCPINGRC
jgi:hypothetical protein